MPRRANARPKGRTVATRARARPRTGRGRSRRAWRGHLWRMMRSAPASLQIAGAMVGVAILWFALNGAVQVLRKPTELFFPVSGALYKAPSETWAAYGALFRRHSTVVMTPALLAALAQVEGSGNPMVRTYWRWRPSLEPFSIYRPASSAVGMFQITDGTFAAARRLCIHRHAVVEQGAWNDWRGCWFNALYFRVVPSHAVELTSAYLDREVARILARQGRSASFVQRQRLAIVTHLCGAGAGNGYAHRGFRFGAAQRCGDHDPAEYVRRVQAMAAIFTRLGAQSA